jgi:hypothetical protein
MPYSRHLAAATLITTVLLFLASAFMAAPPPDRRPLVAIGGIMHESDTFNPSKTGFGDFTLRRTAPREQALDEWSRQRRNQRLY